MTEQNPNRGWESFAPAPAPPLDTLEVPAPPLAAGGKGVGDTPGRAGARRADAAPPRRLQAAPEPAPAAATPPAPRGTGRIQAAVAATLDQLALDVTVSDVTHTPRGYAASLTLGEQVLVEDLEPYAEELAAALRAPAVRLVADGETLVRVEAMRQPSTRSRQVAVWVPGPLRDALDAAKDPEESQTSFVLGAFNRQFDRLGTFFVRRAMTVGPMPETRKRFRRGLDAPTQLWMYLNPAQDAVLDDAVASSGAGSRSALITRILEEDLGVVTTPRYSG